VGFIVTNLPTEPDWVVRLYNQRGTAKQPNEALIGWPADGPASPLW
jgi:hypothetical protein